MALDAMYPVGDGEVVELLVFEDTIIQAGDMVQINSSGYATTMAAGAGLKFAGIAASAADNSGGANGAKSVLVHRRGTVELGIASGASFPQSAVGTTAYADGPTTVHNSSSGRTAVGTVLAIVGNRVRIDFSKAVV